MLRRNCLSSLAIHDSDSVPALPDIIGCVAIEIILQQLLPTCFWKVAIEQSNAVSAATFRGSLPEAHLPGALTALFSLLRPSFHTATILIPALYDLDFD